MSDSSPPQGNSTPSSKPTTAPSEDIDIDESSPLTGKMPGLPPPLPATNMTARPPGLAAGSRPPGHEGQPVPEPPAPGTALHQGERKVGETRSAAADGDNFLALAMVSLVNLDPAAGLSLAPGAAPTLEILRRV